MNDRAQDRREADDVDTKRPVQHHEDDVQAKPADSADAPATTTPVAEVQVAVPEAQPALPQAATEAVTTAPVAPQPDVPQQPQVETPTQTQAQVASAPAPVAAPQAQAPDEKPVVQAPAQAAVAEATQQPAVETEGAAPAVQQQQAEAKPADDKPAQPGPVSVAKPKQAQSETSQQQNQSQQQGSLPQPAAEQARTVAQAYGRVAQHTSNEVPTTAQSGTPAASPVNQFTGGQPAAARGELAPATPVPLSRAAETIEHIMRLASNRGVTHARIALTPESLGSIDVHLRHTSDGVIARVMAHAPEAVHQLQQAAADLRQQLEGQGVNLLSLDIGHSAADEGSAASAGAGFGDEGRGDSRGRADGADATGDDAETTVNSTLQLPNGVLVDVLA